MKKIDLFSSENKVSLFSSENKVSLFRVGKPAVLILLYIVLSGLQISLEINLLIVLITYLFLYRPSVQLTIYLIIFLLIFYGILIIILGSGSFDIFGLAIYVLLVFIIASRKPRSA